MISSDRAFELAANAFAAVTPAAYVRYDETYGIESKTMRMAQSYSYLTVGRTSDDVCFVTARSGRTFRGEHRHLLSPTFDVLSDFVMRGSFRGDGAFSLYIETMTPLHYDFTPKPGVDSVSIALHKYHTTFVDDTDAGSYHIHLDPLSGQSDISPRMFFKDVYVDAKSALPTRVELVGPDERDFDIRYDISSGRPLVASYLFAQTFTAGFGIVRARGTLHASYSNVTEVAPLDDAFFVFPSPAPTVSPAAR